MARRLVGAVLVLLPLAVGRAADDPVPFRPSDFAWIPWVETVEDAAAKGKREHKLVLAFVFPYDSEVYEAGYKATGPVRAHAGQVTPQQADAQRSRDPGFVKEQAALTAWLGNPDLAALVARTFVPVRMRMHTWHFFDGGPGMFADPFPALGTSDRETRPPAVIVSTPEGKLLFRQHRIGVFDPYVLHRTLLAVLKKGSPWRRSASSGADLRTAVAELAAGGDLDAARRKLDDAPAADAAWAAVAKARLDASEGKVAEADVALRALPASPERDALLAEVLVRRGLFEEVAAMPGLADDAAGRVALAAALERLGKVPEARALWRRALDEDPKGPRGARATLHLAVDGPLAAEWETLDAEGRDPLAATTISGAGGEARAVRYLLAQQRPDGSWRPPRWSPGPSDQSVARTALCVAALRAWKAAAPGPELDAAVARGTAYVHAFADKPSSDVWDLTYALHLELDLLAESATDDGRRRAGALLAGLSAIEHDGGWSYMVNSPRLHTFNTAPVLLLLVRARDLGQPVDALQIGRTSRFLEKNRVGKSRVFHYGPTMETMSGQKGSTDEKSTCMRSPVCELALLAAGATKDARGVAEAIDLWFEHQESGRATQKIFESYTDVTSLQDSYRYFFGTWYAAEGLARLPDAKRKKQAARLAAIVRAAQEIDGSFVDSQMVGKASSTALALLALAAADRAAR